MDSTRSILLALARVAEDTRLRWHVERAAVRVRGRAPSTRSEASVHHAVAARYLIEAIRAADLPSGFRVYDVTLQPDPLAAAAQLRQITGGFHPAGSVEHEHEQTRVVYRAGYDRPMTEPEQTLARTLASIPPHRRDKIIDTAERQDLASSGLPVPGIGPQQTEAAEAAATYTVVGVWEEDQPIPVGVIGGDHPVCGGDTQHWEQGLWATVVTAPDPTTAEHAAITAMRHGLKGDAAGAGR